MKLGYPPLVLLALGTAGLAWGEEEATPPDMLSSAVRVIGFLLVFMAVALLVSRFAKRINPTLGGGTVEVLSGRTLAPGVGVRVLRVGSRCLLVGFTKEQISVLAEVSPEDLARGEPLP